VPEVWEEAVSWHYQIIHHGGKHPYYALHEVHEYDEGKVRAWTENPATFTAHHSEGHEGVTEALSRALADANTYPVLWVDG
jgi:hypothetical protein